MPTINIYLTFPGNCEDAFNFYRSVFGGEFSMMNRFSEMPGQKEGSLPEDQLDKIMHVSLPISKETVLMGSDTGGEWGRETVIGNNFSISINADSKEQTDNIFEQLSHNGQITMPLEKTFWGEYFGMFTDQFGINWMISFDDGTRDK